MATHIGLARCLGTLCLVIFCGGSGQPGLIKLSASADAGIQLDPSKPADIVPNDDPTDIEETDADDADDSDEMNGDTDISSATEVLGRYQESAAAKAAAEKQSPNRAKNRKVQRTCRVTAYCDRGVTASGVRSGVGQCAAPADIPLGSVVYIPSLKRYFVVTDRTHRRFRHNTVDLFIPNAGDCREFGRKYLSCEFVIPDSPPAYGKLNLAAARRAAISVD